MIANINQAENDAKLLQQILNIYTKNSEDSSIEELADQLYLYSGLDIWKLLDTIYSERKALLAALLPETRVTLIGRDLGRVSKKVQSTCIAP